MTGRREQPRLTETSPFRLPQRIFNWLTRLNASRTFFITRNITPPPKYRHKFITGAPNSSTDQTQAVSRVFSLSVNNRDVKKEEYLIKSTISSIVGSTMIIRLHRCGNLQQKSSLLAAAHDIVLSIRPDYLLYCTPSSQIPEHDCQFASPQTLSSGII